MTPIQIFLMFWFTLRFCFLVPACVTLLMGRPSKLNMACEKFNAQMAMFIAQSGDLSLKLKVLSLKLVSHPS